MTKPFAISAAALLALFCTGERAHAQLFGVCYGGGNAGATRIFEVDPANAHLSNIHAITLPGYTVHGAHGLALRPGTSTLYAMISTGTDVSSIMRLCTIDPHTGVATLVGTFSPLGISGIGSIAFGGPGGTTLYGASDTYATPRDTLFTIDPATVALTPLFSMGIAYNSVELVAAHPSGLLYRLTWGVFYSVDPATQVVTQISTGHPPCRAMTWHSGLNQMFVSDESQRFYSINITTGVRTNLGNMAGQLGDFFWCMGLAHLPPAPPNCGPADVGSAGGVSGPDELLDNNDFIAFFNLFFSQSPVADLGAAGGVTGSDGHLDNSDFVAFINAFFNPPMHCIQ